MDEKERDAEVTETIQMESDGKDTLMATLAYVGPLVIVAYLVAKDDSYAKFHIKQGLTLFVVEVVLWFLMMTFWFLFPLWQLINLAVFVLAIIGIVNALQGKEKELPFVGKYAERFKI